jgi:hypothetical protein
MTDFSLPYDNTVIIENSVIDRNFGSGILSLSVVLVIRNCTFGPNTTALIASVRTEDANRNTSLNWASFPRKRESRARSEKWSSRTALSKTRNARRTTPWIPNQVGNDGRARSVRLLRRFSAVVLITPTMVNQKI